MPIGSVLRDNQRPAFRCASGARNGLLRCIKPVTGDKIALHNEHRAVIFLLCGSNRRCIRHIFRRYNRIKTQIRKIVLIPLI